MTSAQSNYAGQFADVVTIIRDPNHILGKVFDSDGHKTAAAAVSFGLAVQRHVPTAEAFAEVLREVADDPHAALCNAGFEGIPIGQQFIVLSEAAMQRHLGTGTTERSNTRGLHDYNHNGHVLKALCRFKENCTPSSWTLLDRDIDHQTPAKFTNETMDFDGWVDAMERLLPGFKDAPKVRAGSSSARVLKDGVPVGQGNGHVWVKVADAHDAERLRVVLICRSIDLGMSWPKFNKHGKGGSPTTITDLSVFIRGRLVFCGKPVAEGHIVAPHSVTILSGGIPLDTSKFASPTPQEISTKTTRVGVTMTLRNRRDGSLVVDAHDLTMDTEIELSNGVVLTVAEALKLLRSPTDKLRCQTPFRGNSTSIAAVLRLAKNGRPLLYDVGDNTTHWLHEDPASVFSVVEDPLRTGAAWPDPMPLPDDLPPVMPFTADLLPAELRGWVMDISHRMQCPPDFSAVAAVAALSSLIGATAVVKPKAQDDWVVVPNLWALAVGRPGVMKSPAISEVLKPLHGLQKDERVRWEAEMQEWEVEARLAKITDAVHEAEAKKAVAGKHDMAAARACLKHEALAVKPTKREFIVNDATVEALCEVLAVNPFGVLAYRDEIFGMLTSLDRQGQEGSRSFYLSGYDGDKAHTSQRIARGETHIPRVCISMLGGIQPSRLQSYVRGAVEGGAADDGLLQRFGLTVWPDVAPDFTYVDQWPDSDTKQRAYAVFDRLARLQPFADNQPHEWTFAPEAQEVFVEWYTASRLELKRGELHPAMESHLSKYAKLVPALALIFAMVDSPNFERVIHVEELRRALAFARYLRSHAERLYAAAVTPESSGARALLAKIRVGKLADEAGVPLLSFTARQVAVKHWAGLSSPDEVRHAADLLVDYDWLKREEGRPGPVGGRPSERYHINPAALRTRRPNVELEMLELA